MHDSVPSPRYLPVCNVLCQWKTSLIPSYRVYRLYDYCIIIVKIKVYTLNGKFVLSATLHKERRASKFLYPVVCIAIIIVSFFILRTFAQISHFCYIFVRFLCENLFSSAEDSVLYIVTNLFQAITYCVGKPMILCGMMIYGINFGTWV